MPSSKQLMSVCQTLATMLNSGVQIDRALTVAGEQSSSAQLRRALAHAAKRIESGSGLVESLQEQKVFSRLFLNLVEAGETTGALDRTLGELARLYELQHKLKMRFLGGITMPVLQYIFAVLVLALVPYVQGLLAAGPANPSAMLPMLLGGYGIPIALVLSYFLILKPLGAARAFHEVVIHIPVLGGVARCLAVARFSLVLHLMYEAGVGLDESLDRSFRAAGNPAFATRGPRAAQIITDGGTLTQALRISGLFEREYLEVIAVGEETGKLSERLDWLASHYAHRSESAIATLTRAAAILIWCIVAGFIIYFIFKFFLQYVAIITRGGI